MALVGTSRPLSVIGVQCSARIRASVAGLAL
jgi:hypothetical protein